MNDSTVEKLGELLKANTNGLLLFRDELPGFLETMERQGHEGDRAFYLEAWNGTGSFVYDRIGRGTVYIPAACLSVLGAIQPGPLAHHLREAFSGARDDGFIQRFQLAVYPDTAADWTNIDRWPDRDAKAQAFDLFKALERLDPRGLGAEGGEPDPGCGGFDGDLPIPFLRFAPDAQTLFDEWRGDLEHKIRRDDEHPVIASHLAKYRSVMPSLALLFHLIDHAVDGTTGPVSRAAAEKAAAWCNYLEAHARRIYQSVTARLQVATALLAAKIRGKKLSSPFTGRDVYQNDWTGLTKPAEVGKALDLLEELGWVRREDIAPTQRGGRPTVRWYINPRVWA